MLLAVGCSTFVCAGPAKSAAAQKPEPAFNGAISIDGPSVWVDAKKPGRLVRLRFRGKAGERLGLGLSNVELAPESASTLVVTLRGSDGEIVPASRPMRCFAETDLHPIDGCDGQFTLAKSGTHVIEVDTPFTASARFKATLSTPASAPVAADRERSIELKRTGQPARFRIAAPSGKELTVSARDASPGRGGGEFMLRIFRADGTLLSKADGTPELGASLPIEGDGADYWAEIAPAHAKTGVFLVSVRAAAQLAVDGAPLEFTTRPNEVLRVAFSAHAGEGIALAVDALAHQPDVDSNSRFVLFAPDGSRVAGAACMTHALYGLRLEPCKFIVPKLPATGRYKLEISPPVRAGVSGRLMLTEVVKGAISPGTPVALGPMRPGQVALYTLSAAVGQRVGVRLEKIASTPEGNGVRISLMPESQQNFGMFAGSMQRGTEAMIAPQPIRGAGTYVVVVDPVNGALQSGELSIAVVEGKPQ